METTTLNVTLFVVTALVAIALAVWQFRRSGKAKSRNVTSAMNEPAEHGGKYNDDGTPRYKTTGAQDRDAATDAAYRPAQEDKYKAAS